MDVRAGPIEPIDDTNNPCELPGAIIPTMRISIGLRSLGESFRI